MKKIILPFLTFLFCINLSAQFGSFENENNCTLNASSFADIDCAETWFSAGGSPDMVNENTWLFYDPIAAPDGEFFALMAYETANQATNCWHEAIYKELGTLNQGSKYLLTFEHRIAGVQFVDPGPIGVEVFYTSGLSPNQSSSLVPCQTFGGSVFSEAQFDSEDWVEVSTTFIGDDTKDQLAFAPYGLAQGDEGAYLVDDVQIVNCDDFAPDFRFVNENGDDVESYCYGEDVYIMIDDVDYWIGRYYMSAESEGVYLGAGWQNQVTAGGPWNISQIFRDEGLDPFTPDQIWDFKLAVNHPDCGWVQRVKPFEYICCEIDAGFSLVASDLPDNYRVDVDANFDYTPYGGTHEFCLMQWDDNLNDFDVIVCSNDPSTWFGNLPEGHRFYITHVVTTPCGEFCESIDFCSGDGCEGAVPQNPCDYVLPQTCINTPPEGLSCPRPRLGEGNEGQFGVTWDPIPGVGIWQIEIIQADPDCRCEVPEVSYPEHHQGIYTIDGTNFRIYAGDCFSYRIRAFCPEEQMYGPWSDKVCYPGCEGSEPQPRPRNSLHFSSTELKVYPNPFSQEIKIELKQARDEQVDISVFNQIGQVIHNQSFKDHEGNVNTSWTPSHEIAPGLYFVRISNGATVINKKVIYSK